jgi:hypothetical protein
VVESPSIKARLAENGIHGTLGHDAFAASLAKQFADWPERIKTLGIAGE